MGGPYLTISQDIRLHYCEMLKMTVTAILKFYLDYSDMSGEQVLNIVKVYKDLELAKIEEREISKARCNIVYTGPKHFDSRDTDYSMSFQRQGRHKLCMEKKNYSKILEQFLGIFY